MSQNEAQGMSQQKPKYDFEIIVNEDETATTARGVLRKNGVSSRLITKIVHSTEESGAGSFINDMPAKFNSLVRPGDKIGLVYPKDKSDIPPEDIPIEVLYEDENFLAVNKPKGIVVHPTKGHPSGTMSNAIAYKVAEDFKSGNIPNLYKIRFVNRLDMGTSGVLLIAKNSFAQTYFGKKAKEGNGFSD
jgi:23S rRNA pseudouridine1911/1915/1917 synthase